MYFNFSCIRELNFNIATLNDQHKHGWKLFFGFEPKLSNGLKLFKTVRKFFYSNLNKIKIFLFPFEKKIKKSKKKLIFHFKYLSHLRV